MVEPHGPRFFFEGRPRTAGPGESLLDVLVRGGLPNLQRSPHYHRPRAPLCGIGQCTGCLVRVNGRPNVRACRYEPGEGDRVETENGWPSRRFDVLAAFDLLFPSGLDTLHGFRRPAWATRFYHVVVRRLTGFGAPPSPESAAALTTPPEVRTVDVVLVGAGRAGRACASRLVEAGLHPLVVDRSRSTEPIPGTELLTRTTVSFLPPPHGTTPTPFELLAYTEPARGWLIRARRVVVAVGSYDAALLFGSNDRPGVMTADGALAMTPSGGSPPFRAAVVFGAGDRATQLIRRMGEHVEALVAPSSVPPDLVRVCSDAGVSIYPRSLLVEAHGRSRVRSVELVARGSGSTSRVVCDAVVLAHRRLPNVPVLFQVGARMQWRGGPGAYYPEVDAQGRTSVPGVWAVGSVTGARGNSSPLGGERAARALLGDPERRGRGRPLSRRRTGRARGILPGTPRAPPEGTLGRLLLRGHPPGGARGSDPGRLPWDRGRQAVLGPGHRTLSGAVLPSRRPPGPRASRRALSRRGRLHHPAPTGPPHPPRSPRYARPRRHRGGAGMTAPQRAGYAVAIVGAGIVGLFTAYHLARAGAGAILVVDRGFLSAGASGRNGGGVRQQWDTRATVRLARESVAAYRRFGREFGYNIWFRQSGYLFLAETPTELARLRTVSDVVRSEGLDARILDAEGVARPSTASRRARRSGAPTSAATGRCTRSPRSGESTRRRARGG